MAEHKRSKSDDAAKAEERDGPAGSAEAGDSESRAAKSTNAAPPPQKDRDPSASGVKGKVAPDDAARPPPIGADPALSADARPKGRRARLVGVLLFAGLVVGAALYGLWPLIMEGVRPAPPVESAPVETPAPPAEPAPAPLPLPEPALPEPPLPEISLDDAMLESRLDAVEQAPAEISPPPAAALDALIERIAVLEAAGETGASPDSAALAARLDEIDARLALGGAVDDDTPIEALASELAALDEAFAALSDRLDALEAQQAAGPDPAVQSLALVLGLAQLRDALARGAPYTVELAGVAPLLADRPDAAAALDALTAHAARGVPTREALRARFPALARAVVTAALAPEGAGWVDETLQKLADVVSVRRTGDDIEGPSAEARVARAEVRLAAGELADAVAELDGLQGAARDAAQDWLGDARARLGAEDALGQLGRVVTASLAPVPDAVGAP